MTTLRLVTQCPAGSACMNHSGTRFESVASVLKRGRASRAVRSQAEPGNEDQENESASLIGDVMANGKSTRMPNAAPSGTWFQRETAVFYKATWVAVALAVLWILASLVALTVPIEVVAGIAFVLLLAIPFLLTFAIGVLTIWGVSLICLGLRQKEPVFVVATLTVGCSVALGLLAILFFPAYR